MNDRPTTRWVITDGPADSVVSDKPPRPLPPELSFFLDDGAEIPVWVGGGMLYAAWLPVSDELRRRLIAYQDAFAGLRLDEDDPWPPGFLDEGHRLIAATNIELGPKGHRVVGKFEFAE